MIMIQLKKTLSMILLLLLAISAYAQSDITKFLGIPVDGTKSEIMEKLKSKGFKYDRDLDCLMGDFNGNEVSILIGTYKDKVWRILLADVKTSNEAEIKNRFNRLCKQFLDNKNYMPPLSNYIIPQDEDISYEMNVNKKRYDAYYFQVPADNDKFLNDLNKRLFQSFTEEQINNPTDEDRKKIEQVGADNMIEMLSKKQVWFTIYEQYGEYRIAMYYENGYNSPNGEDL